MSISDVKKITKYAGGWNKIPFTHREIIKKELGSKNYRKFISSYLKIVE